ncbi:glycosyltransferase family 4 protein [Brevibacillus daliensis]|uniref:glycosyltransferase family 4 protein n=1 Tax=Brevibacillus daliensis TaxID=2892995 RepID=UPI001E3924AE|nr:glycosyltransferase family 4 protein [Brevibacillus daliensis]
MKVLVIWRLLTVGGVNAGWRNRAIYFKQNGIETHFLYTTDHGGMHMMKDVATVFLTKDSKEICKIIRSNNYDAIIIVDTQDAYYWLKEADYQGPVIVEARTPEIVKLAPQLAPIVNYKPELLIVPSEYQRRVVSILFKGVPCKVIYNGVNRHFFRPLSLTLQEHWIPPVNSENKKIVGWIGRLDKRKNWLMLCKIAKLVQQERDDIQFWIIGGNKSVQKEQFATYWHEKNLTSIIQWFPVIPYQEMPMVYAKIKESGGCTLATTRGESFGNTFIESMACGVPVVAPAIASIPEIILHGITGRLYREEHVRGAIKQLYRVIDAGESRDVMSDACVNQVATHFDISLCANEYVNLLRDIVDRRAKSE